MPLYDYHCLNCGSFSLSRSIADRDLPALCPGCHLESARVVGAPNLRLMAPGRREAFARNEKSRHEPGIRTTHRCGQGCGCGPAKSRSRKFAPAVDMGKAGSFEQPPKAKRPWMLGH